MNQSDLAGVDSRYYTVYITRLAEETGIKREKLMELFDERLSELRGLQIERHAGSLVALVTTHPDQFDRELDELYKNAFQMLYDYVSINGSSLK